MAQPAGSSTSKTGQSVALTNPAQSDSVSSGSWFPFQLSGKIAQLWNSFIQSAFDDRTEFYDTGFQTLAIPLRAEAAPAAPAFVRSAMPATAPRAEAAPAAAPAVVRSALPNVAPRVEAAPAAAPAAVRPTSPAVDREAAFTANVVSAMRSLLASDSMPEFKDSESVGRRGSRVVSVPARVLKGGREYVFTGIEAVFCRKCARIHPKPTYAPVLSGRTTVLNVWSRSIEAYDEA